MGRPAANEVVVPRLRMPYLPAGTWKVTARYTVQLSATRCLACIRVRGPYAASGNGVVLHLSVDEFNRLFKKSEKGKR